MSVKISWLRLACDIFGMNCKHLTSMAMMEEIDESEYSLDVTLAPARLALSSKALDDTVAMDDAFISQLDANWTKASSVKELPPKSIASSVSAWLSTLHLIVDRYSAPCGIYVASPICLRLTSIAAELPGAMYIDLKSKDADCRMYVLVPPQHRESIIKLERRVGDLGFKIGSEVWMSISTAVYSGDENPGAWLGSPFGYHMILRRSLHAVDDVEDLPVAGLEMFDPDAWAFMKGLCE